ncbi:MAG: bifunctional serine/threonine-protein kinase/formylglycine-generating enzyme family protein [bacterium]
MYYCRRCEMGRALAATPCRHGPTPLVSLAGFTVGSFIGQGAHGRVFGCTADGREWAVKIIDLRTAVSGADIRRLVDREKAALVRLRHRHVIALHQTGEHDELLFLVVERLEETLRQRMQQPIALPRALEYAACLADALAYVHDAGSLHRDVKPENIGFRRDDSLALFDFGLAADRTTGRAAHTTGVVGTWPYAAPEQILTRESDQATDVYSLGAVLFELFTGGSHRPVPDQLNPVAWLAQPIPAWPTERALPVGITPLADLIHACLAREPGTRPAMWQVQDALGELADRAHLDFARLAGEHQRLTREVEAARAEAADLTAKSKQARTTAQQAEARRATAEAEGKRLAEELDRLRAEAARAEDEAQRAAASRRRDAQEAETRAAKAEARREAAEAKRATAEASVTALQAERDRLTKELERLRTGETSSTEPYPEAMKHAREALGTKRAQAPPPTAGQLIAPATATRPALRWVPSGTFTMGSPPDEPGRGDDEVRHPVTLSSPLLVMETPITQGQWAALLGTRPSYFRQGGDTCPVERVSWYEAVAFANALSAAEGLTPAYRVGPASGTLGGGLAAGQPWAAGDFQYASVEPVPGASGYRLPTEAEWEGWPAQGRRGPSTRERWRFWASATPALDPIAWYGGNSAKATHPVGQKAANPWGLHDVLGNVYEWCWDGYAPYPTGMQQDPHGPPTGVHRVVRGGSWITNARWVRSANRNHCGPVRRYAVIGFRLVRPPSSVGP